VEPPERCTLKERETLQIDYRVTSEEEITVSYQWYYKLQSNEAMVYPCEEECLSISDVKTGDAAKYFCKIKVYFPKTEEEAERTSRQCQVSVEAAVWLNADYK